MIMLKQVIHDLATNSIEATWVDRIQLPDTEVPESFGPTSRNEDGNIVPGELIPAHIVKGGIQDTAIKCHSYADVQMQMFRDDAAQMGTPLDEYEDLIDLVKSNIKPVVPGPKPKVHTVTMAQARKALILSGFDLAKVEVVFQTLPQPAQALARVDWEFAPTVHRDNPLVAAVQRSENWTDNQVDALFDLAATL